MEVRLTLRSEIYLEGNNLTDIKAMWENISFSDLVNKDGDSLMSFIELNSVEEANTLKDLLPEWKNGLDLRVQFEMFGKKRSFTLNTQELDRNHESESYAYWCVEDEDGTAYEINIFKDEYGCFEYDERKNLYPGVVYGFYSYGGLLDARNPESKVAVDFQKI